MHLHSEETGQTFPGIASPASLKMQIAAADAHALVGFSLLTPRANYVHCLILLYSSEKPTECTMDIGRVKVGHSNPIQSTLFVKEKRKPKRRGAFEEDF